MRRVHVVQQGECLASIGARYGVPWRTLHDHPDNAELKRARRSPHVLAPGDEVVIPDHEPKEADCATDGTHRFTGRVPKVHLRIVLQKHDGTPLGGKRYVLTVGRSRREGRSAGDGLVEVEVPARAEEATLEVYPHDEQPRFCYRVPVRIGHLDPVESDDGALSRLRNLGHPAPDDGRRLQESLREFQERHGLSATGKLDDATRRKLVDLHQS